MSAYQFQPDPTDVITKRYVAAVIDVAMEWIVWIIAFVIAFAVFSHDVIRYDNNGFGTYRAYKSTELTGAGWVFVIVIGLAYMVSVFVIWRGQTGKSPGTLMLGLVTVNEQGAPLGVGRALLRSVAGIVDYIGICSVPIVGIATSASSKGHRRVGDMAAKSLVVDKQYAGQPLYVPALNLATAAGPYGQAYGQPYGAYPGQPYAQPYGQPGQPVGQPFAQPGQAATDPSASPASPASPVRVARVGGAPPAPAERPRAGEHQELRRPPPTPRPPNRAGAPPGRPASRPAGVPPAPRVGPPAGVRREPPPAETPAGPHPPPPRPTNPPRRLPPRHLPPKPPHRRPTPPNPSGTPSGAPTSSGTRPVSAGCSTTTPPSSGGRSPSRT